MYWDAWSTKRQKMLSLGLFIFHRISSSPIFTKFSILLLHFTFHFIKKTYQNVIILMTWCFSLIFCTLFLLLFVAGFCWKIVLVMFSSLCISKLCMIHSLPLHVKDMFLLSSFASELPVFKFLLCTMRLHLSHLTYNKIYIITVYTLAS